MGSWVGTDRPPDLGEEIMQEHGRADNGKCSKATERNHRNSDATSIAEHCLLPAQSDLRLWNPTATGGREGGGRKGKIIWAGERATSCYEINIGAPPKTCAAGTDHLVLVNNATVAGMLNMPLDGWDDPCKRACP